MQVAHPPQQAFRSSARSFSRARRSLSGVMSPTKNSDSHNISAEFAEDGTLLSLDTMNAPADWMKDGAPESQDTTVVDMHELFKVKMAKSSEKLEHFFGVPAPHDICIKEIKKEGLKAILESKVPLCYFLRHLLDEFSGENLFFFIELEQYEEIQRTSPSLVYKTAEHLSNVYLNANSHFEVNVDEKVRIAVLEAIKDKNTSRCFKDAKRAVYALLEPSFESFMTSRHFRVMEANCGELTTCYDIETREKAVAVLQEYIENQDTQSEYDGNSKETRVKSTSKKRHALIRSMVREFCHSIVRHDMGLDGTLG